MSKKLSKGDQWLSLSAAAKQLNIHPSTLRRWADNGSIAAMVTPGGHRRFKQSELDKFAATDKIRRRKQGVEKAWAQRAIVDTRQGIQQQTGQSWLEQLDDPTRQQYRQLGRQLMGLTLQYVSQADGDDELLTQAHALGEEYGRFGLKLRMPLKDALQASMFFRDTLIETAMQLPDDTHIPAEKNLRLLRRINKLLNTVHLAIAEVYDDAANHIIAGH